MISVAHIARILALLNLTFTSSASPTPSCVCNEESIERDVAIIGGGATGTLAGIHLKDAEKSIIVVEKMNRLGGPVHMYTDPRTGTKFDFGTQIYFNQTVTKDYLKRLNISITNLGIGFPTKSVYANFKTGQGFDNYTEPNVADGLPGYVAQLSKYPYLEEGFNLTYPVPEDLPLPFGDFVDKYNLQSLTHFTFFQAQGMGNQMLQSALYVLKYISMAVVQGVSSSFLTTVSGNTQEIYDSALKILQLDTKQLLIPIQPRSDILQPFDLDSKERDIFDKFSNSAFVTGLINNTGLQDNLTCNGIDPMKRFDLPTLPGMYNIYSTSIPSVLSFKYGVPTDMSTEMVKADVRNSVIKLRESYSDDLGGMWTLLPLLPTRILSW
ncbi:hypothetical protein EJ02DRAFT_419914 [Clathrospora elynae]|uniref:Amine oxidase domain-containing protein n=1 Tax=Clathrospora elynae TaxID=706981 RepID=A0A6A5SYB3_9PLEO|nr:hypothetical protein EJ02DRAFT_419914 [Clathrospora elynae]